MADISKEISKLERASKGDQVRDTIVDALNKINTEGGNAESLGGHSSTEFILKNDYLGNNKYFDETPIKNSIKAVTSRGLHSVLGDLRNRLDEINDVNVHVDSLEVTENGVYDAGSGNAYNPVQVNVQSGADITGATDVTATAATAISKGDTVYFDSATGDWEDISSTANLSNNSYINMSSDGTRVWDLTNYKLHYIDTTKEPYTLELCSTIVDDVTGLVTDNISNKGVVFKRINDSTKSNLFIFDLNSGEVLKEIETNSQISTDTNTYFRIFENYIINRTSSGIIRINIKTGEVTIGDLSSYSYDGKCYNSYIYDENTFYSAYTRVSQSDSKLMKHVFNSDGSFAMVDYKAIEGNWGTYSRIAAGSNKLFIAYSSQPRIVCVKNYRDSSTNWEFETIEIPEGWINDSSYPWIAHNSLENKLLFTASNKALGLLYTDTMTWNVVGFGGSSSTSLSDNLIIGGNKVYKRGIAGTTTARKANNHLQNVKQLGYATEDVAAGQSSTFKVIFR